MIDKKFGKNARILSAHDFAFLQQGSSRVSSHLLKAYFKKREDGDACTRLGFSISKKVGNAVARNRVRRILRELFRLSPWRQTGYDILLVVSPQLFKKHPSTKEAEKALCDSFMHIMQSIASRMDKNK